MIFCEVVETVITSEDSSDISVFGFRFINRESKKEICIVEDVFTGKEEAVRFMELVNSSDVSELHIKDIIEDAASV